MKDKAEYIKYILLSCLEGNSLFDFYISEIKSGKITYENLKQIFIYLLEKNILIIYDEDRHTKLKIEDSKKLLETKEIWEDYNKYNPLVLTESYGIDYYHEQIYVNEIKEGTFPNFEVI